jgi:hypothetical protein
MRTNGHFFKPGLLFVFLSLLASFWLTTACRQAGGKPGQALAVEVSVDKLRPEPGDTVQVSVWVKKAGTLKKLKLQATLLVPTLGAGLLELNLASQELGLYKGQVSLPAKAPAGFYAVTVTAVLGSSKAVGKSSFIVGKVIGDFMIVSAMPEGGVEEDASVYMKNFMGVGGNMLIVHDIINKKAWYPSKVCARAAEENTPDDRVGTTLKLADKFGLPLMITVVWDMTKKMPYAEYMQSTKAVMNELWELYGHHPSLIGFYSYQEGSGTYLAAHVREFSDAVKSLNKGLLAGCAPYIDDPLLAGYLAAIENLDVVIYQGAVMASYRPDNRKCFAIRRTKDFAALSAGATLQKNKIALSHVELFGYQEKSFAGAYLAGPDDISGQIMSAASCYGPDGITLFTYHYNIYTMAKKIPDVQKCAAAVERALEAYPRIAREAANEPSGIGIYIPYSDWWADRWTESIIPALDGFRKLGAAVEIVPFIPAKGEEILPYYPFHLNEEQLEYLLSHKSVLVLPDIAGMQDTDSLLLKTFIERGGAAVLFGPRIPFGDQFNREDLVGGNEEKPAKHWRVEVKEPMFARARQGKTFDFAAVTFPSWTPTTAKSGAVFEDGSTAVLINEFGKGLVITIPVSLFDSVGIMPDLIRDILDLALSRVGRTRPFDIEGGKEDMDFALSSAGGEYRLAAVNYGQKSRDLVIYPLNLAPAQSYVLTDLRSGKTTARLGRDFYQIRMTVRSVDFIALKIKAE